MTAFSAIAGGPPSDPRSMDFIEWVVGDYLAHRLRWLARRPTRSRTVYVDPQGGNDENDGAFGSPVATLSQVHDILAAESDSVEVVFAAGAVFRERGKDHEWLAADGGHFAAIHVDRNDVTFRNADDGDPPEFWCGNNRIAESASWSAEGTYAGVYEIDVSGQPDVADDIGWVIDEASPTTRYTRAASVAAMDAVDRCFYFDGSTDTLYVRVTGSSPSSQAWFLVPNNALSGLRIEGDGVLVNMPGATWYGWGLDEDDTNSHNYAVSVGATGTNEVVVRPGSGYYGSAHIFGTWQPGAGAESGGIAVWVGVRGGLNQPVSGPTLLNLFQPGGGMESVAIDCSPDQPSLDGTASVGVNGHTSMSTEQAFWIAWGCDRANMNNLPTYTSGTEDDCRGFTFFCGMAVDIPQATSLIHLSPILDVDLGTQQASSQNYDGTMINGVFVIDGSGVTGARGGWFNSSNPANSDGRLDHCLIEIITKPSGADQGIGFDFDVMFTNGVTTDVVARACVFQRAAGSTKLAGVGIGDEADQQIDCGYFEMAGSGSGIRDEAGYESATNPIEMTARVVMGSAVNAELDGHATRQCEYDHYLRPRLASDAPGPIASGALATASPREGIPTLLSIGDGVVDARLNQLLSSRRAGTPGAFTTFRSPRHRCQERLRS